MVSLPGDSASSDRVVTTPYATASNAQTTASNAPWSDRKLGQRGPSLDSDNAKRRPDAGRRSERAGVYRGGYWPGTQRRRTICAGPGRLGLLRFVGAAADLAALPPESCT